MTMGEKTGWKGMSSPLIPNSNPPPLPPVITLTTRGHVEASVERHGRVALRIQRWRYSIRECAHGASVNESFRRPDSRNAARESLLRNGRRKHLIHSGPRRRQRRTQPARQHRHAQYYCSYPPHCFFNFSHFHSRSTPLFLARRLSAGRRFGR